MTAIAAYGCHLPLRRLPLAFLQGLPAPAGGPERTVAWADEDSVTMAVAAARDCLAGRSRDAIDLVIFATTSYAFAEKQGAAIVARALGLPAGIRAVDIAHSLRGGTQALLSAFDAVASGRAREALVVAADCRMGAPGSELERNGGDAAVAILVGDSGLARLTGAAHCGEEIVDVWRRTGDRFTHGWEERFVAQHGYLDPATKAGKSLQQDFATAAPDSWRWAISAPDARGRASLAGRLGLAKEAVKPGLSGQIGFCGAADALLQLAISLDVAKAGQRVAVISPGDGAEALLFAVETATPRQALAALRRGWPLDSIEQYRRARDLTIAEYPPADDQGISATVHLRERDEDISLVGQRCVCGTHQFPKGRVCGRCGRRDQFQPVCYADAAGQIVTYTLDAFFPSPDPPTPVGIVQVENGPRIHMQIADIAAKDVAKDMAVRFAFRRIHQAGLRPNYFWKAVPAPGGQP